MAVGFRIGLQPDTLRLLISENFLQFWTCLGANMARFHDRSLRNVLGSRFGVRRSAARIGAGAALVLAVAACSEPDGLAISGPSTSSEVFIDFPAGPVNGTAAQVSQRLRSAGFRITAVDQGGGLVRAQSPNNSLVDCGTIYERRDGITLSHDGNARRLQLADEAIPGGSVVREVKALTSVGLGITAGVTNTVVVRQVHSVTVTIKSGDERQLLSEETLEFTDQGFAQFSDGTVCRSSNAMGGTLS
jgi:hypothetical protein